MSSIEYRVGDLLETPIKIIAHGCNALGVMGAGVAKLIRTRWPEATESYFTHGNMNGLSPGEVYLGATKDGSHIIINAITQRDVGSVGKFVDYEAVYKSMRQAVLFADDLGLSEIAVPKIGAGLAGGDWDVIESILKSVTRGSRVKFVVYVLPNEAS